MAKTVAKQIGVSGRRLARKIAKVKRHDGELTNKQAVGKAVGILKDRRKKRRKKLARAFQGSPGGKRKFQDPRIAREKLLGTLPKHLMEKGKRA